MKWKHKYKVGNKTIERIMPCGSETNQPKAYYLKRF